MLTSYDRIGEFDTEANGGVHRRSVREPEQVVVVVAKDAERITLTHGGDDLIDLAVIAHEIAKADHAVHVVKDIIEGTECLKVRMEIADHGHAHLCLPSHSPD